MESVIDREASPWVMGRGHDKIPQSGHFRLKLFVLCVKTRLLTVIKSRSQDDVGVPSEREKVAAMTTPVAGWYDDPWSPEHYRYWDGNAWTPHTSPKQAAPYRPEPPASYGSGYGAPAVEGRPTFGPTTPDGVPLSGWWRRVGARILDQIIVYVMALPLTIYFWIQAGGEFADELDRAMDASRAGRDPGTFNPSGDFFQSLLVASLITLVVAIVYEAFFLRRTGATWGKQALGIKVRLREYDGQLAWATITRRLGFMQGLALLGTIPLIGIIAGLAGLLNYLWPLWDKGNQALHDKFAGTNVVKTR
jgi:uncharacterized RDD family membrane protein YckC